MIRVSLFSKRLLSSMVAISWVSGIMFFAFDTWGMVEGDFGLTKHPWQQPCLMIHGASAFTMLMVYGFFIGSHAITAWKKGIVRRAGMGLSAIIGGLIISGYWLYYGANLRTIIKYGHVSLGFILPIVLATHINTAKHYK